MVALPGPSQRTLGIAKWLGRTVAEGTSDAFEKQENAMSPVPESVVALAKRLDIDITGLKYGFAWPIIKRERAKVEAELLATRGWLPNGIVNWRGELWLITEITPRQPGTRKQDMLRLKGLTEPKLVFAKGRPQVAVAVQISLSRSSMSVSPLDLIDAETLELGKLQLV
ncbi:MAG TPA: hypothetical protein VM581_04230 [Magnetospirillaceae bacterium]|nr:hypothetical protein [Magnetospirillaceae bacterium]